MPSESTSNTIPEVLKSLKIDEIEFLLNNEHHLYKLTDESAEVQTQIQARDKLALQLQDKGKEVQKQIDLLDRRKNDYDDLVNKLTIAQTKWDQTNKKMHRDLRDYTWMGIESKLDVEITNLNERLNDVKQAIIAGDKDTESLCEEYFTIFKLLEMYKEVKKYV